MRRDTAGEGGILQGRAVRSLPLVLFVIFGSEPAYAYIDPGSGGLIIQALIGAVATVVVAVRLYWQRMLAFFSRFRKKTWLSKGDS
jgi:hypothetical protein